MGTVTLTLHWTATIKKSPKLTLDGDDISILFSLFITVTLSWLLLKKIMKLICGYF